MQNRILTSATLPITAIIATSGPSSSYPSRAYRNPIEDLVRFLDYKHGSGWAIWEFRAEGAGYPDEAVYGRVSHFPWPDHHPPPFGVVPAILKGMREWLTNTPAAATKERSLGTQGHRAVVVHCKAGKGRSGTMGCAYLLAEEGWTREDAMQRFTDRRMRPGFGAGITIPSQLRWLTYVERWRDHGKVYLEQEIEITEVHVWGLRLGVKIAIEGYVEDGRKIKTFHVFTKEERSDGDSSDNGTTTPNSPSTSNNNTTNTTTATKSPDSPSSPSTTPLSHTISASSIATTAPTTNIILRPAQPIRLPTNDVNLACERRTGAGAAYGWALVTSVAHVWFNTFFEGAGPERCDPSRRAANTTNISSSGPDASSVDPPRDGSKPGPEQSGVFEIAWPAMDGIKGSSRKGKRSFDRVAVAWSVVRTVPDFLARREADAVAASRAAGSTAPAAPAPAAPAATEPAAEEAPSNDDDDATGEPRLEEAAAGVATSRPGDTVAAEEAMTGMAAHLGLRRQGPDSVDVSRAESRVESEAGSETGSEGVESDVEVTRSHGVDDVVDGRGAKDGSKE